MCLDFIKDNELSISLFEWNWQTLSRHPNMTWDIIINNPSYPWNDYFGDLSQNPNITWDIIQNNPSPDGHDGRCKWDWDGISKNPNITWDIIETNPDKRWWCLGGVSDNENITWEIVKNNLDKKWFWYGVARNTMKLGKKHWIAERRLKHIKAFQIQRHWRLCSCNPEYKLAQRCLLRLHDS